MGRFGGLVLEVSFLDKKNKEYCKICSNLLDLVMY